MRAGAKGCVLLAGLIAGCSGGGDHGGAACSGTLVGCGGTVTGTWKLVDLCHAAHPGSECPDRSLDLSGLSYQTTFSADGTYSGTNRGAVVDVFPAACITASGIASSCDQLKQAEGFDSCTASPGGGCRCTEQSVGLGTFSGTWSTSGTTLTLTANPSGLTTSTYCVDGNTLRIGVSQLGFVEVLSKL